MIIRKATIKDLKAITAVEATCFPPAEAASRSNFKKRLKMPAYMMKQENGRQFLE